MTDLCTEVSAPSLPGSPHLPALDRTGKNSWSLSCTQWNHSCVTHKCLTVSLQKQHKETPSSFHENVLEINKAALEHFILTFREKSLKLTPKKVCWTRERTLLAAQASVTFSKIKSNYNLLKQIQTYLNFCDNPHSKLDLQGGRDCTTIDQSFLLLSSPENIKHWKRKTRRYLSVNRTEHFVYICLW